MTMQNNHKFKDVIGGAISLTVSAVIVKIIGLIYKIPLSYILSDEGMGYFNSAYTVYIFFYIVSTAGIPKSISILTSKAESEGDSEGVSTVYKTAFGMFFVLGLIITFVLLIFAKPLSILIGSKGSYFTMLAIAPSIIFVSASGVLRGYFNGRFALLPIAVSEMISAVSKLVLGLLFAYIGYKFHLSFEIISALTILGITFGSFFSYAYLLLYKKVKMPEVERKSHPIVNKYRVRRSILEIALPITLTSSVGSLGGIVDLATIMNRLRFSGYTELQSGILYGNYTTLVLPMFNLIAIFVAPISSVILPIVSSSKFKKETEELNFFIKVLTLLSMACALSFLLIPEIILSVIFEDSSASMAAPLLRLFAPSVLFMSYLTVFNTVMEGVGKTRIPLISLIAGIIVKFFVSYITVGMSEYGIYGAAIGSLASYVVSFVISYFYMTFALKIKLNIMPSLLITGITGFVLLAPATRGIYKISSSNYVFLCLFSLIMIIYFLLNTYINSLCNKYNKKKLAKYTKK